MYLRLLQPHEVRWTDLDAFADRTIFQTKPWIELIAATQHGIPVVAELCDSGQVIGYFTGLVVRKCGLRILGSPLPGWTTPYIGFNLQPGVPIWQALVALRHFAFHDLGCVHLEITDPHITQWDAYRAGYRTFLQLTYYSDLTPPTEAIFYNLHRSPRRGIQKAESAGVTIEQASDIEFADEYYRQLEDVFAKQGLVPSYDVERVRQLIKHLLPTGNLLLLRARDPEGHCIATCIHEGMGRFAYGNGNGSYRAYQHLCPNQALHWYSLRYWKARGAKAFDWVGGGDYKQSYGAIPAYMVWCRTSRMAGLETLRNAVRKAYRLQQVAAGTLFHHSPANPATQH
jgi:hypothetical protein